MKWPTLTGLVLLPFAVLVALGFWLTERPLPRWEPPVLSGEDAGLSSPSSQKLSTTPTLVVAAPPSTPLVEPEAALHPELAAAIHQVRPHLEECFSDAAERYPGEQRVSLSFQLDASERLNQLEVSDSTIQDPWVQACLVDALAEAQLSPSSGRAARKVNYPFIFRPQPAR